MQGYILLCPPCQLWNAVQSDTPEVYWTCDYCKVDNWTSLPTTDEGDLISQAAAVELGKQEAGE